MIWAGLAEKDEALAWLQMALGAKRSELIYLGVDPMLDGLRADPGFAALARHVGVAG